MSETLKFNTSKQKAENLLNAQFYIFYIVTHML